VSDLTVELVAADRRVWTGPARFVRVRTVEGDLGVMPGHAPILGVLATGVMLIEATDGQRHEAMITEGFLSVDHDRVTIVAQSVDAPGLRMPANA